MKVSELDYIQLYALVSQIVHTSEKDIHPAVSKFEMLSHNGKFELWSEGEYQNILDIMNNMQNSYEQKQKHIAEKANELVGLLLNLFEFQNLTVSFRKSDYPVDSPEFVYIVDKDDEEESWVDHLDEESEWLE